MLNIGILVGGASHARGFHPRALPEPDVNLSAHTAPSIQPFPCRRGQWAKRPGVDFMILASQSRTCRGRSSTAPPGGWRAWEKKLLAATDRKRCERITYSVC